MAIWGKQDAFLALLKLCWFCIGLWLLPERVGSLEQVWDHILAPLPVYFGLVFHVQYRDDDNAGILGYYLLREHLSPLSFHLLSEGAPRDDACSFPSLPSSTPEKEGARKPAGEMHGHMLCGP